MSLSDLPANQLAIIDTICLKFESDLRQGKTPQIDTVVSESGIEQAELLRIELQAIQEEIANASRTKPTPKPFAMSSVVETPSRQTAGSSKRQPSNQDLDGLPKDGLIGPYKIVGELGRGGMGVVLDAIDTRLERRVAIKMLALDRFPAGNDKRIKMTERFEREAKAVAALSHPNIVELFDVGASNDVPYAVMEYLQGETLDQRLERDPLTTTEVRLLGTLIAEALADAHRHQVVHRDLKPQNVMLVDTGDGDRPDSSSSNLANSRIKLFDFGLSRIPYEDDSQIEHTRDGVIMGTPGYMSPEQARGDSADSATDIYSLGCILYEAFFGKRAILGDTVADRIAATLKDAPEIDPIRKRDDAELSDLIEACLQKEPLQRPTASAVAQTLADDRVDLVRSSMEAGYESGRRSRRRFVTSLSGGVIGAVVASLAFHNEHVRMNSIAVLPLIDKAAGSSDTSFDGRPVGDRLMDRGQRLAVLLINELSRISDVEVRPYRPIKVPAPNDYTKLGAELAVEAILSGTIENGDNGKQVVNMQLISTDDGRVLWGKLFEVRNEELMDQAGIANEVAGEIGHKLARTKQIENADQGALKCLMDGKARSDPDSVTGLTKALKCFEMARDAGTKAGRDLADTHSGIALTAISLASRCEDSEIFEYIRQAQSECIRALELDEMSVEARLARAMIAWQTGRHYRDAKMILSELVLKQPFHWRVKHQYGLLLLTMGDQAKGVAMLREAAGVNPLSVLAKVDLARAQWASGNSRRAKDDALRYMKKFDGHPLVRGLLIDIYEQEGSYKDAAEMHVDFGVAPPTTKGSYVVQREKLIAQQGYGPFGPQMNQVLFAARFKSVDDEQLANLIDQQYPTLPYLLSVHPAMRTLKRKERATELLSDNEV